MTNTQELKNLVDGVVGDAEYHKSMHLLYKRFIVQLIMQYGVDGALPVDISVGSKAIELSNSCQILMFGSELSLETNKNLAEILKGI